MRRSALRPSGRADFGGHLTDVITNGVFVEPGAGVRVVAIEGARDDISGLGQTRAALTLATNLPADKKRYYMAEGAGHYGIFNGSRWRDRIAPVVEQWMAAHA